jgi:hypothetical protein
MKIKRELITKLFDETPEISHGRFELGINNWETSISISSAFDENPFQYFLTVFQKITPSPKRPQSLHVDMLFEEEWPETRITFTLPGRSYGDDKLVLVDIHQELNSPNEEDNLDFCYIISKKNLFENIFNLIETNLEQYNKEAEKDIHNWVDEKKYYTSFHPLDKEGYLETKREILKKLRKW